MMEREVVAMRVGLYARVSTTDKDQDPENQLAPLREFCAASGWTITGEFVDHASAVDLPCRKAWREVLTAASRRRIDVVACWKLDRAFRSVAHASSTLQQLRSWGVALRSLTEPWADTSSPQGELVFNLLATFAQFERSLIAERIRAGMARARKQGKRIGRPPVVNGDWGRVATRISSGEITRRQAAEALVVSVSTVRRRILAQKGAES
jgi:DNA invertase Pin-like site-specific DNA recombinase